MAYSHGRKFRRIAAAALTADPGEMRALIERILPPREEGAAPVLRIASESDWRAAPAAIVAAFFADKLTGGEAADLLRQAESREALKQAEDAEAKVRWARWDAQFLRGLLEGPALWGIEPEPELRESINRQLAKLEQITGEPARCGAAGEGAALVMDQGNTSARAWSAPLR